MPAIDRAFLFLIPREAGCMTCYRAIVLYGFHIELRPNDRDAFRRIDSKGHGDAISFDHFDLDFVVDSH